MKPKQMATELNIYSVLRTCDYYGPASHDSLALFSARRLAGTTEPAKEVLQFCKACVLALHASGLLKAGKYGVYISRDGYNYVKKMKEIYRANLV